MSSLSKKVQSSPSDPQARQKLGIFLMRQGEVVEGLDQLARSAVLYQKDGFATKAIAVLRQMLKHDPGNNDFRKWLIRLLAQEGLSADAQAEVRKVAAEAGRFASDEQRLEFFRQAAEYLPRNPLPRMYLCDVLRGQRKLMEAVNELEKAAPSTVTTGMYPEFGERLRTRQALSAAPRPGPWVLRDAPQPAWRPLDDAALRGRRDAPRTAWRPLDDAALRGRCGVPSTSNPLGAISPRNDEAP